ncbi:MAG: sulfatase-like hydrolase/transferase [Bacteroidales bacterium]|nr:sulfatase-like hydrolase/transferase [Bacteroidales bacterium]
MMAPSLVDVAYYSYNLKRLTFEILDFVGTVKSEFIKLFPRFLLDYWWLVLLFIALLAIGIYLFIRLRNAFAVISRPYVFQLGFVLFLHFFLIIGARGSVGYKPLSILSASTFTGAEYSHIVLNSTFTIIKTMGKTDLYSVFFFDDAFAEQLYPYCKSGFRISQNTPAIQKNVIIIAVESLSSAYMGFIRQDGITYTPFLDSLCQVSLVFPYAFANCKRSIEGIPAILSGYPALTHTPLLVSAYACNTLPSLSKVLHSNNYHCVFFHGGRKGTMMLDKYTQSIEFDQYFSFNDYHGNQSDYDGYWGIYDEPFLHFTIQKINNLPRPFFAFIFTLSSHHPYRLPQDKKNFYHPNDELPILSTIRYADYSLKQFFKEASQQTWFRNTIFIITADHTAQMPSGCFQHFPFNQALPIIFYDPSNDSIRGVSPTLTQQIDIFPSIIDYLDLQDTVCCFGNSFFSNLDARFAVMYVFPNVVAVFPDTTYIILHPDGKTSIHTYPRCLKFPIQSQNLNQNESINIFKAFYQQYVHRTKKNLLWRK